MGALLAGIVRQSRWLSTGIQGLHDAERRHLIATLERGNEMPCAEHVSWAARQLSPTF
jgi:hypothetical protein